MKIALIGYGKMGRVIEQIALSKGHEIVLRISSNNAGELTTTNIQQADVCIEFSTPQTAHQHVIACLQAGVPVVCGSTAWLEKLNEVKAFCKSVDGTFLYASNFSIGVNLFFKINEQLAQLMKHYPAYRVCMEEIHHTQKLDAPSGTAVTLAEGILANSEIKKVWVNHPTTNTSELEIISIRQDPAPGTHVIHYQSTQDEITLTHTALTREGFASGALLAAEFVVGRKGIFTMSDVLGMP